MPVVTYGEHALDNAERFGITKDAIAAIMRNPSSRQLDPSTVHRDYTVERWRSGDVIVIVSFRDYESLGTLHVIAVRVVDRTNATAKGARKAAAGATGSTVPTTMRELRRRIVAAGFRIELGPSHDRVVNSRGGFVLALPKTPSDVRTIPNVWRTFERKRSDVRHEA